MSGWIVRLCLVVVAIVAVSGHAAAERRLALVVGNNAYPHLAAEQQLRNAVNDAKAVKAALLGLGFEVLEGYDLSRADLVEKLSDFAGRIQTGDVAMFFYAGHGIALGGTNYILPVDMTPPRSTNRDEEGRLTDLAIPESRIIERMRGAGARVAVVVLDACRDSPLKTTAGRSVGATRGLAPAPGATGVLSLYSAGSGQAALDRLGPDDRDPNSVFTRVFVDRLKRPGLGLRDVAVQTRDAVVALASSVGQDQVPALYEQIVGGDVYLAGLPKAVVPPVASDELLWAVITDATVPSVFESFIRKYPASAHVAEARAAIERLNAALPRAAAAADELFWSAIADQKAIALFTEFMRKYPTSSHMGDARARIAALLADTAPVVARLPGPVVGGPPLSIALGPALPAATGPATPVARNPPAPVATYAAVPAAGVPALSASPGRPRPAIPAAITGHRDWIRDIAVSPDGRRIASASNDGTVRLWDVEAGRELRRWTTDNYLVSFSADGKQLAFGSGHGIEVADAESGAAIRTFAMPDVSGVAFSPDGKRLATGGSAEDNAIAVWDLSGGARLKTIRGHRNTVQTLRFSRDGRRLLSSSTDNSVRIFDAGTGAQRLKMQLSGGVGGVDAALFSGEGDAVFAGSWSAKIRKWNARTGKLVKEWKTGPDDEHTAVALSPDGALLASAGGNGKIAIWDTATGDLLHAFPGHNGSANALAFAPDGAWLASGGNDRAIRFWNLRLPEIAGR